MNEKKNSDTTGDMNFQIYSCLNNIKNIIKRLNNFAWFFLFFGTNFIIQIMFYDWDTLDLFVKTLSILVIPISLTLSFILFCIVKNVSKLDCLSLWLLNFNRISENKHTEDV